MPNQNVISPAEKDSSRKRRPLTIHLIVNHLDVEAGADDHWRALCGHTFKVRYGIVEPSPTGPRREYVRCQSCDDMKAHEIAFEKMGDL